jgi:hypothetical protein
MARKVGELVLYACQMEEAVLQIKRFLDDVRAGLAWQLLAATVDEVERSDLAREVSAMVHALDAADAEEARRAGCLHYAKLRLGGRLLEPD